MLGMSKEDWEKTFKSIQKHSNASKKREFLFKFFNRLVGTNTAFCHVGVRETPKCTYCGHERQNYQFLFVDCSATVELREALEQYWFKGITLSLKEWMLGTAVHGH